MVIWLSICLSLAQLFLLRPLMTVVVHSFVADSSLLDCCDLVVFFCVVFFHLMLAGRQPFGILRWFQLFVSFIWCQLFACLIRAANFRLLPAFVVWSFFLLFFLFFIQYNKYNTIIQHISAPVPTVDNTHIQIYMLMLYIHNRQKRYIHTDKELDKVLHRQIVALHKA